MKSRILQRAGKIHDLNVKYYARKVDGSIEGPFRARNLTVNAGLTACARQSHNPAYASAATVAQYVAVTANTDTPLAADTTLTGEISSAGLGRSQATYADGSSAGQYTLTLTMTYTGSTPVVLAKAAVFDDPAVGNMWYEALFSPNTVTVNNNGDQVTLQWAGTEQAA